MRISVYMWDHNIRNMMKPKKTPALKKATNQSKKNMDMNGFIVTTLPEGSVSTATLDEQAALHTCC